MNWWKRSLLACLVLTQLLLLPGSLSRSIASYSAQSTGTAQEKARAMLANLTPEERVGQLFLVTFQGSTFDENSQIYDLLANHHVGGVVLLRSNDNFSPVDNVIGQTHALNRLLQESEWKASQRSIGRSDNGTPVSPEYIPLLIAVSQEGDEGANDQILNSLTPQPDLMSIGATWDPSLAEKSGAVLGQELSSLGFNLFLGPSLDVLSEPKSSSGEDLGVRSFGGSPYWVGKMGQAYISGLHEGSKNRLMVIAKQFPGRGSADRSPDQEIATVRKSFDELKQVDLTPFFSVTGNASDNVRMADGMLVSHIRYQGLQGNIRSTTRPVSADGQALDQILKLPPFAQWRETGGVLISDDLGSQAIRRFYDPTNNSFDARTAAREAFFAGNDLLFVDRFIASNDPDTYTTIIRTMDFFDQKYREDAAFAQRVDASVERILTLKYKLYPEFNFNQVLPAPTNLASIGKSTEVTFDIARRSVTLISPDPADLLNILPRGPETRDRVIFLTDVQSTRQCSTCTEQVTMQADALRSAVLRLYGPKAGGQISQSMMTSYAFSDLEKYLNGTPSGSENDPELFENDLKVADWVVVSMLKPDANHPDTLAFRRLLTERPDLLRNKKVIVFAFNSPQYLDATDISKLTAYYGLYSKTAPFVDVAARVLFQELSADGVLPVSVSGVGYDVSRAVLPDQTQVIPLIIDNSVSVSGPLTSTQEPTPVPVIRVGDVISLRTGVIYDHNHNPVPDGTPVTFVFSLLVSESSGPTQQPVETETVDGIARATYRIDRPGLLEIHAASAQNTLSSLLRVDITSGISAGVTLVAPTSQPTETYVPTPTVTVTVTPTVQPTPLPPAVVKFQDWFFALVIALIGAIGVSWLGVRQAIARWGLRWALCGLIGGLLFYNYLALKLPGSDDLLRQAGTPGVLLVTLIGILVGWAIGLVWRQLSTPPAARPSERGTTGPKSQSN